MTHKNLVNVGKSSSLTVEKAMNLNAYAMLRKMLMVDTRAFHNQLKCVLFFGFVFRNTKNAFEP